MVEEEDEKNPEESEGSAEDLRESEEPEELKKPGFPEKKVTAEIEEDIIKRLNEGESKKDIASTYKVSTKTIARFAKKHGIAPKHPGLKKPVMPSSAATVELVNAGGIEGAMRMSATREIIRENVQDFEQVVRSGKLCVDKFRRHADAHGLTLNDYLEQAIVFYENHRFEVDQLRADLETALEYVESLEVEVRPFAQEAERKKRIEQLVFVDALTGGRDQELRREYLSL